MSGLNNNIKLLLSKAVELWADENLIGKPAILTYCIYNAIETEFLKQINEINDTFKPEGGK